jgi:hypothetical protein
MQSSRWNGLWTRFSSGVITVGIGVFAFLGLAARADGGVMLLDTQVQSAECVSSSSGMGGRSNEVNLPPPADDWMQQLACPISSSCPGGYGGAGGGSPPPSSGCFAAVLMDKFIDCPVGVGRLCSERRVVLPSPFLEGLLRPPQFFGSVS